MKIRNFKSKAAYNRWAAYGHIHHVFEMTPGNVSVRIHGKPHRVIHRR